VKRDKEKSIAKKEKASEVTDSMPLPVGGGGGVLRSSLC